MARKANNKKAVVEVETETKNEEVTVLPETETNKPDATKQVQNEVEQKDAKVIESADVDHFSNVVLEGKAKKLSLKTTNHVFYELLEHDDLNALYIRLSGNEGGGLHSKEWIKFEDVIAVLTEQGDKPFKSTVLKSVFKGGSANNSGFLAACCRGLGLIIQSEKSVFLHQLAPDFEQRCDELLSLVGGETKAK
ncbi:hypothetical protein NOK75_00905 [Vibrio parahaemolyticus]|uniref:hypothetical protein n=1 Tax=Vibrio parahaemolyticus TaxID=670 RepID=UPI00226B9DB4|nr:hypothetical protein [Vibrio parahaemolyticus]MCX8840466.1 hypothetical protein [Vibrio parahaemolyticus]HCH0793145.1 hypothetical protein [Vibrio parahaemolyticus]